MQQSVVQYNNFIEEFKFTEQMNPEQKLKEYEHNMKVFIQKVEKEVSLLIEKYEREIEHLKQENQKLKTANYRAFNPEQSQYRTQGFSNISPIKKFKSASPEVSSTFFITPQRFPKIDPIFNSDTQFEFRGSLNRSRFESTKIKQKQKQENLIQSLESGKYNLDLNTSKMLELFGKEQKHKEEEIQVQQEGSGPKSVNKSSGALNSSLASICSSLDKSFHAQKSREKKQKKKKKEEEARQKKMEEDRKNQKKRKDQGVKNLLKNLRNNVNSINQQPQIIRGNKLLSSGNQSPNKKQPNRSKVMFNPVPVDISERSRNKANNSSLNHSQPQSILKNSSRILTKSLIGNITSVSENY